MCFSQKFLKIPETDKLYINEIPPSDDSNNFNLKFPIKPTKIGILTFKVSAVSPQAGDAIEKPLRVISEGIPRSITTSTLLVLDKSTSSLSSNLSIEIPNGVFEDTIVISATVAGNILSKTLNNLENLIQMPSGCGEQTLLLLVPDIAIWDYLQATNQLKPDTEQKLRQFAIAGYQNELNYQRKDGSFSAFGESDPSGSSWLTAYAVKAFNLASKYIEIDSNVMTRALDFIASNQEDNGSFKEPGRVIHADMQGGSAEGTALTAYISGVLTEVILG